LAPGDTNPQGIADPPPPDMLLTTTQAGPSQTSTAQPLTISGADWAILANPAPANPGASVTAGDPEQLSVHSFEVSQLLGYDQTEDRLMGVSPTAGPHQLLAESNPADNLDLLDQVFASSPFLSE
jgi:hypothetical protein